MQIVNQEEGRKPIALKIKVQYSVNGQQVVEMKIIN
jgi:hypothetical protein